MLNIGIAHLKKLKKQSKKEKNKIEQLKSQPSSTLQNFRKFNRKDHNNSALRAFSTLNKILNLRMIQNSLFKQNKFNESLICDVRPPISQKNQEQTFEKAVENFKESQGQELLKIQDDNNSSSQKCRKKPKKPLIYKNKTFQSEQIDSNISNVSSTYQINIQKCETIAEITQETEEQENRYEKQIVSPQSNSSSSYQSPFALQQIQQRIHEQQSMINLFQNMNQMNSYINNIGQSFNFNQSDINFNFQKYQNIKYEMFQEIKIYKKKFNFKKYFKPYKKQKKQFYQEKFRDEEPQQNLNQDTPYQCHLSENRQDIGDWELQDIKKLTESDTDNEQESLILEEEEDQFQNIEKHFPILQIQRNINCELEKFTISSMQSSQNIQINTQIGSTKEDETSKKLESSYPSLSTSFSQIEKIEDESQQQDFLQLSGEKASFCGKQFEQERQNNLMLNHDSTNKNVKNFELDEEDKCNNKNVSNNPSTQNLSLLFKTNILLKNIKNLQADQVEKQNLIKKLQMQEFKQINVEQKKISETSQQQQQQDNQINSDSSGDNLNQWQEDCCFVLQDEKNGMLEQNLHKNKYKETIQFRQLGSSHFYNSQKKILDTRNQDKQQSKENNQQIIFQKFLQQRQYLRMQIKAVECIKDLKLGCKIYNNNIYIYEKEEPPFMRGFNIFQCSSINLIIDWCQNESEFQDRFQSKIIVDLSIQDQFKGFFNQILLRPDGYLKYGNLQLISKYSRRPIFVSSSTQNSNLISQKETCKAMEFTLINLKFINPKEFYEEINQCNKYLHDKTFDFEYIDIEYLQRKCQESLNYEFKLIFENKKMVRQIIGALNSLAEKTNFIFGISDIDRTRKQEIIYNELFQMIQFNKKNIFDTLDNIINQTLEIIKQNMNTYDGTQIKAWKKQHEIGIQIDEEILVIEFQILKISDKLYPIKMVVPSSSHLIMVKNENSKSDHIFGNYTYVRQNASVNILTELKKPKAQKQYQEIQEISLFYDFKKEFFAKINK